MSRTYKDEPYFIKVTRTDRYGTSDHHYHQYWSYAQTYNRILTIVVGERTVEKKRYVPIFASEYSTLTDETELVYIESAGRSGAFLCKVERTFAVEQERKVVYKKTVIEQSDHTCTINDPVTQNNRYTRNCTVELAHWQLRWNRPNGWQAKNHHDSRNQRHRTESRHMVKLYNSGESIEDFDYDTLHERMHEGWWD